MKLTTKEIVYLSASFTEQSPISLFSNLNVKPDGTEYQSLVSKGIIQGNSYNPEALDILMLLAKPEKCTRLVVQNDFCIIEKYTYKCGDKIVLAENSNGDMIFSKPKDFSDVIIGLSEFFGMSKIKTTDVSVSLEKDEILVLLAIIDIYRKNSLLTYAGQFISSTAVSTQEVISELYGNFEKSLVKILTKNYNYKTPLSQDIDRLLGSLVQKNCLISGQGYKLTENYADLAKNFLILEAIVLFESFEVTIKGEILTAGSLCVTAGLHDIISFLFDGNSIELSSLSGSQMLITIENYLTCPTFVQETVKAPHVRNEQWQCTCGNPNTGNFCSICGSKRTN